MCYDSIKEIGFMGDYLAIKIEEEKKCCSLIDKINFKARNFNPYKLN